MTTMIHNGMNTIDLRDIVARIAELKPARDAAKLPPETEESDDAWTAEDGSMYAASYDEEQERELNALEKLVEQLDGRAASFPDCGIVRGEFFEEYCQQTCEDLGDIGRNSWLASHVDWTAAAIAMQQDWAEVDFDGVEYWARK